jgi:hypothetical protein
MGIGIVVVVPEDGPMKIYGKTGNSSHDAILHEMVPIELHNRVVKVEYTYPHVLRLDAPDEVCRQMAFDLGVAETGPFGPRLNAGVVEAIHKWIAAEGIEFDLKTLQGASLQGADLREADLRGASLQGADLREADLRGANLRGASLREANLRGANLRGANLREADLREADLQYANLQGANLRGADLDGVIGLENYPALKDGDSGLPRS